MPYATDHGAKMPAALREPRTNLSDRYRGPRCSLQLVTLLLCLSCTAKMTPEVTRGSASPQNPSASTQEPPKNTSQIDPSASEMGLPPTLYVTLSAALPACTPSNEGQLAYVKDEDVFKVCATAVWTNVEIKGAVNDRIATTAPESAGSNCPTGGVRIDAGRDNGAGAGSITGDWILQAGEVLTTRYVCTGATGATGAAGATGFRSLISTTTLSVGDTQCAAGGLKISSGLDDGLPSGTAGNGTLEAAEIETVSYVCNGLTVDKHPPATVLGWVDASPLASRTIRPLWNPSPLPTATSQSLTVYADSTCTTAVTGAFVTNLPVFSTTTSVTIPTDGDYWYKVLTIAPEGTLTSSCSSAAMTSDMTAPAAATSLAWSVGTITTAGDVTVSWTKSTSSDLHHQEVRLYSDASCGTQVSQVTHIAASAQSQSVAITSPRSFLYVKVLSYDGASNLTSSVCSATRLVSDLGPAPTLASANWVEPSTTSDRVMTAAWAASSDPMVASLEVQLYADANCTTAVGTRITGIAPTASSKTVTLPSYPTTYRFKVFAVDLGGDMTGSACSTGRTTPGSPLAVGGGHICALRRNGTVECWGRNEYGQLGNGTTVASGTPVQVTGITTATGITVGDYHSCALLEDKTIKCWGEDYSGKLGDDSAQADSSVPVTVAGISTAVAIDSHNSHTCAILEDGSAKCWGYNGDGQVALTAGALMRMANSGPATPPATTPHRPSPDSLAG